jgi:hypothetical protein
MYFSGASAFLSLIIANRGIFTAYVELYINFCTYLLSKLIPIYSLLPLSRPGGVEYVF